MRIETLDQDDAARAWSAVRERAAAMTPGPAAADKAVPAGWRRLLAWRGGEPAARLAAGVVEGMAGAPGRTGLVGWYEAADADGGVALLRRAREALHGEGAERVVGPLNGSTWARYRLALPPEAGAAPPPFLSEPQNPAAYPEHFAAAGFTPLLDYESRVVGAAQLAAALPALPLPAGVRVCGLDLGAYDAELHAIHALSLAAFAQNPFYTPLGFAAFRAFYERLRPLLDPALVRLAVADDGALLGFVFAFADPWAPPEQPRLVLKTLATAPAARGLGIGAALTDAVHRQAAARGAAVIHALMQCANASLHISHGRASALFRRYRLYRG